MQLIRAQQTDPVEPCFRTAVVCIVIVDPECAVVLLRIVRRKRNGRKNVRNRTRKGDRVG
jgi:hypothetical protein